ncbi:hypothetical protein HRbin20_01452 [bacterium HR20]|nr:hypothetical protein HRbin20_01452 [bacterium HR20]
MLLDVDAQRRSAVEPIVGRTFCARFPNVSKIADANFFATRGPGNNKVANLIERGKLPAESNDVLVLLIGYFAGGEIEIRTGNGLLNLCERNAVRSKPSWVELHLNFPLFAAEEDNVCDTRHAAQARLDVIEDKLIELSRRQRRGRPHSEDGKLVEGDFVDHWVFDACRELSFDCADLALDILQREIHLCILVKLDRDDRDTFLRRCCDARDLINP